MKNLNGRRPPYSPSKAQRASNKFFSFLLRYLKPAQHRQEIEKLVDAAFRAYALSWGRFPAFNIYHWNLPYWAARGEASLDGYEPWTVLLRKAVFLARKNHVEQQELSEEI